MLKKDQADGCHADIVVAQQHHRARNSGDFAGNESVKSGIDQLEQFIGQGIIFEDDIGQFGRRGLNGMVR